MAARDISILVILLVSLCLIASVVWLASMGQIDAVRAAIFTGAIGQMGAIATAMTAKVK